METTAASPWTAELAREILERHAGREGALLPILHDVQASVGWVPDEAAADVALALNLSRAEVHGVLTFYHDFRRSPPGARIVKLCQAEACQARGARAVAAAAEAHFALRLGATSLDGAVTLEPIYCLGLCASGPAALVDGWPVARLQPDDVERLLEAAGR
jgi:formate dehydrogenase subunit gamma